MARTRGPFREDKTWAAVCRAKFRRQKQRFDTMQAEIESVKQCDREDIVFCRLKQEDLLWFSAEYVCACTIYQSSEYAVSLDKRKLRRLERRRSKGANIK